MGRGKPVKGEAEIIQRIFSEDERGQMLAQLRDIASHANRHKNSRSRRKRNAMRQEERDG